MRPLESAREDVQRLMAAAKKRLDQAHANKAQWAVTYWDGYIRGLEHVLEMEDQ
jgi:hypothetical protein